MRDGLVGAQQEELEAGRGAQRLAAGERGARHERGGNSDQCEGGETGAHVTPNRRSPGAARPSNEGAPLVEREVEERDADRAGEKEGEEPEEGPPEDHVAAGELGIHV